MQQRLIEALRQGFPADAWALVIGDLMLDRYLWGKVERISPEAPVPVVLLEKESSRPGGAANVAANLAGLGLPCRLLGTVGDDAPGRELVAAIASQGVGTEALFTSSSRPTTTKTRILGGHQQMLRLDELVVVPHRDALRLLQRLLELGGELVESHGRLRRRKVIDALYIGSGPAKFKTDGEKMTN